MKIMKIMKIVTIVAALGMGLVSHAKVPDFNSMIQEASASEKLFHKKLLQSLGSDTTTEVAARRDAEVLAYQQQAPQGFEVRLVQAQR